MLEYLKWVIEVSSNFFGEAKFKSLITSKDNRYPFVIDQE